MSSRFLSSLPWLILLEIFPSIDTRIYNSTAFIQYLFTLHLLFWTIMLLALTFIHLSHHTFAAHLRFPWTTKIRKDGVLLRRLRTGHWPRFAACHTSNECASCSGSVGWFSWSEISCSLEVASYFWTLIDHEAFLNARDNWYPGYICRMYTTSLLDFLLFLLPFSSKNIFIERFLSALQRLILPHLQFHLTIHFLGLKQLVNSLLIKVVMKNKNCRAYVPLEWGNIPHSEVLYCPLALNVTCNWP